MSGARCRARPPCGRSVACAPAARTVLTRSLCSGTRPAGAWSGREQLRDCGYLGVVPLLSRAPSTRGGFRTSTSCRTASAASADTVGPDSFREPTGPAVPAERAGSRRHRAGVRSATGRGRGLRPRPRVAKTVGAARRLRPSAGASFDHMVVVGFIRTVQASAPHCHAVQRLRQGEVGPDRTAVDRCADGLCCHSSSRSPRRAGFLLTVPLSAGTTSSATCWTRSRRCCTSPVTWSTPVCVSCLRPRRRTHALRELAHTGIHNHP